MKKILFLATLAIITFASCGSQDGKTLSGLDPQNFVGECDGDSTALFVLKNEAGMEVCITNYGGRIVSVMVPDKDGDMKDVVLGFDNIKDYIANPGMDFGASIGRYANRINKGQFTIGDELIQLPTNNYGHTLHGGPRGWQSKVYKANQISDTQLELTIDSPDGDQNFPGHVIAVVTYTLTEDNAIDIDFKATTDKETIINMTNHCYFNLNGDGRKPITDNILYINATKFTPVDSTFMTTGAIVDVFETPFDFNTPTAIGKRIDNQDSEQLRNGHGYDHNWVLNTNKDVKTIAATVESPTTGIILDVYTDQPGLQVYTGNFLDGTVKCKGGIAYEQRTAICLEPQVYPDSPNKRNFPSPYLTPGKTYSAKIVYKFSVKK